MPVNGDSASPEGTFFPKCHVISLFALKIDIKTVMLKKCGFVHMRMIIVLFCQTVIPVHC